ncbi:MAG: hypothetical protein RLY21_1211 [Planctomycetota bacterium]
MKSHADVVRCQTPSQPSRGLLSQRFARLLLAGAVLAAPSVAYAQSACDADLDANGEVNGADLTVVLVSWVRARAAPPTSTTTARWAAATSPRS